MLLKILAKIPKKWGLYRPNRKLAVGLFLQPGRLAVDRPVDRQRSIFRPLEGSGRPPKNREHCSLVRSAGPMAGQTCTDLCTSAGTVGRSTGRSTGPESPALCIWAVDRTRELCSLYLGGRSGGRPGCSNGRKSDRWRSTDRSTGRSFLADTAANS